MTEEQLNSAELPKFRFGTRFERVLELVEKKMVLDLPLARATTDHAGSKGANVEEGFRDVLRKHVPSGFGVGHGKVVDAYDDDSSQLDVIVTNRDHPFSYPPDQSGLFIIDGVSSVGEVKSVLTTGELGKCIKAATRYKKLRPTYLSLDSISNDQDRRLITATGGIPPYVVFAYETDIAPATLGARLRDAEDVEIPEGKAIRDGVVNPFQPPIDAVCIFGVGVYLYLRGDSYIPRALTPDGTALTGWFYCRTDAPMAMTIAWLQAIMPRVDRGSSVLSAYMTPQLHHRQYMEARDQEGSS